MELSENKKDLGSISFYDIGYLIVTVVINGEEAEWIWLAIIMNLHRHLFMLNYLKYPEKKGIGYKCNSASLLWLIFILQFSP